MVELNPFRSWVPKAVGSIYYLLMLLLSMSVDCVYSSILNENVGQRGMQSDDVMWALNGLIVGMAAAAPFSFRVLRVCRLRIVNAVCLSVMIVAEFLARDTEEPLVLVALCVLMGFARMNLMMINMMSMLSYLTGKNMSEAFNDAPERTEQEWQKLMHTMTPAMAFLYLILMSMTQAGTSLVSWMAYVFCIRSVYDLMMLLMALMLVVGAVLMPLHWFDDLPEPKAGDTRWPFTGGRMLSALVFTASSLCIVYAINHGYNQDWFASSAILLSLAAGLVLLGAFLLIDWLRPEHERYWNYELLAEPSARWALLLYVFAIILNSGSMLVTVCSQVAMQLDQWHSACLSSWVWVGYVVGTLLIVFTFRRIHYHHYATVAFAFFCVYALAIYITVQTQMEYDHLVWLTVVRGTGIFLVYVCGMVMAYYRRRGSLLASWITAMFFLRNIVSGSVGVALYQQGMLIGQQEYLQGYATAYNAPMVVQSMIASVKHLAGLSFWLALAVILVLLACNWQWLHGGRFNIINKREK